MKTLLVNTYDIEGGAARAAYRLHKGLQSIGVDSAMLVQDKLSDDSSVLGPQDKTRKAINKLRPHIDNIPLHLYRRRLASPWGLSWLPGGPNSQVARMDPDVVHLHWICQGFMPISSVKRIKKPVVWTLHDSWAFTGGCHIPYECLNYRERCGACPQLKSTRQYDLSRWVWQRKRSCWRDLQLTVVTPSRWLADCAQSSSLLREVRIEVIPNGLDLTRYKPLDKKAAREILGLPKDEKIILFGAMNSTTDQNKGFHYLHTALRGLAAGGWGSKARLAIFGASESQRLPDFGLPVNCMGRLHDDFSLNMLYAAADVFVAPSVQENLSNTVMEALACGTPCVAFNIGGMPDLINHEQSGYLARPYEASDLARGISWVLQDEQRHQKLALRARADVEQNFELASVAKRYASLYEDILGR